MFKTQQTIKNGHKLYLLAIQNTLLRKSLHDNNYLVGAVTAYTTLDMNASSSK